MSLLSAWRAYRGRNGLAHELITLVLALVTGIVILPLAIYAVGRVLFGAYTRSATDATGYSALALWSDFLAGLGHGSLAHWIIAVGPYLLYQLLKLGNRALGA